MEMWDINAAVVAICALGIAWWPSAAAAQSAGGRQNGLKSAGNDATFRVIERFPGANDAAANASGHDKLGAKLGVGGADGVDDAVRAAVAAGQWKVARLLLAKQRDGAGQTKPYVALLDAYLGWHAGQPASALASMDGLAGRVDALEDYRLVWAAKAALAANKPHQATLHAAEVPRQSRLYGESLMLLATALAEAGTDRDLAGAKKTLRTYLAKYPGGRNATTARLKLAKILEQTKSWHDAGRAYLAVIHKDPVTDASRAARARLAAIRPHLGKEVRHTLDHPTIEQQMVRWRALFEHHRSKKVIAEVKLALPELKSDKSRRCEGLYLVAKSYSKRRQHTDAAAWYARVVDQCADTPYLLKALYLGGKGFWNAGKRAQAKKWFEQIWTDFSDHSFADDAMYFTARILGEQHKSGPAGAMLHRQVKRYPDGDMAQDAHWLLVRAMFAAADYDEVVTYVDGLDDSGAEDIYSRGRLPYFRALALQKLGRAGAAKKAYQRVIRANPLSYYAYLGFNRLAQLGGGSSGGSSGGEPAGSDICDVDVGPGCGVVEAARSPEISIDDDLTQARHFVAGVHLIRLGLTDLAEAEFRSLNRHHPSVDQRWSLAYLLDAARAYPLSHDIVRRHIDGWKSAYPIARDDPRWSLAYPTAFDQEIDQALADRKLPRALVWAIMREESGFNPRIESWANARGLMQLMKPTAANIAQKMGLKDYRADALFEPATNLEIGAAYLDELAGQLDGRAALIIAGYNGGYTNVARWLKKRPDLPLDLWIEDIPYGQTRKYVKRVLASFWAYSWLYGPARVPRVDFGLPTTN